MVVAFENINDSRRLQALLEAILLIESELDLNDLLTHIVIQASQLVGARYGALGVLADDGVSLSRFVTHGMTFHEREAVGDEPRGLGLLGTITREARSHRVDKIAGNPLSVGFPANHPPMTTFLGVPIRTSDARVFGNLYFTEKEGGKTFTAEDEALIDGFGRAAGLLIDEATLRLQVRNLTLTEERERMARDLHDTVIQRLFAVGLSLQTTVDLEMDPGAKERIGAAIDDLDATIHEIRTTIFEIVHESDDTIAIRPRVLALVDEVASRLEIPVDVKFEGPLDSSVGMRCADHLTRSLRELLTNVVRHADAHRVAVSVEMRDHTLIMKVEDDGNGFDPTGAKGRGLINVTERARQLDGTVTLEPGQLTGTRITWIARRLD